LGFLLILIINGKDIFTLPALKRCLFRKDIFTLPLGGFPAGVDDHVSTRLPVCRGEPLYISITF